MQENKSQVQNKTWCGNAREREGGRVVRCGEAWLCVLRRASPRVERRRRVHTTHEKNGRESILFCFFRQGEKKIEGERGADVCVMTAVQSGGERVVRVVVDESVERHW